MEAVLRESLSRKNGNRVDLLRVLLTVGIVCRHATMTDLAVSTSAFDAITQGIIWLTEVCVPLFYVISGYLYFRNAPLDPKPRWFLDKYKSRFFSLVIPYLIANVIAWGCYYFAIKAAPSMVSGFFGDNWKDPVFVFWTGPVNMSLWFIRELILVVLVSPLIFLLVRYLRWWGVLALGVLWACKIGPAPLFFFSLGACEGIWKIAPVERWLMAPSRVDTRSRAWTYFVYLYHYLLIVGVKKGLVMVLHPQGTLALVGVYLLSVVLVLGVLTVVYGLMRRVMPGVTGVIVGGK
ncbi:MAG: acyltransferase [Bacteroidales bacterium]|nr:acyltransferase [Bacteroidales bacterium]